jgi:hypothetical protein
VVPIEHSARPQPRLRSTALLVFVLLTGLLGMHGLDMMGGQLPEHGVPSGAVHGQAVAAESMAVDSGCDSPEHDCRKHAHHADPTCASGAVDGPPALPAPTLVSARLSYEPGSLPACAPYAPEGGRAPPSLAELQLLRI